MSVESVCFPIEHRFLPAEGKGGGYTCRQCQKHITESEFAQRLDALYPVDGNLPLTWCEECKAYHVPTRLWGSNQEHKLNPNIVTSEKQAKRDGKG